MADPSNGRGALAAGGLAAILASTCCLGPLLLITLGFSGAWIGNLTALEPYRPIFIGVALVALFFAAATEIAQGPIDGRTPSMSDFIADAAGVGLGLLAGGWVAARAQRNRA